MVVVFLDYVDDLHWADGMFVIYEMLGEFRLVFVFEVPLVLLEPDVSHELGAFIFRVTF